jgi:hypothetical protein
MNIEEATEWVVIEMFDYDDYYQVGRDVMVDGKLAYQKRGSRYRNRTTAQAYADRLNKGE